MFQLQPDSINFKKITRFYPISNFYMYRFLNQSVKHGKHITYYKYYYKYYYSTYLNFFFFFEDGLGAFGTKKKKFILKWKKSTSSLPKKFFNVASFYFAQDIRFLSLDFILFNFFKFNTFILSFFVEKHKTYINHKKRYLDSVVLVFVNDRNKNFIFFKFLKVLFLKKKYKKRLILSLAGDFFNFSDSLFMALFKNLIFEIGSKKKQL